MNTFDTTVGGGISSLLAQNREFMGEPGGAFNFAPKNEPVLKMAQGGFNRFGEYIEEDTSYLPELISTAKAAETKTESSKPDIVSDLNAAGLKETKPNVAATSAPSIGASNLIQKFKESNPNFGEGFDYSMIGRTSDEGDFGSIQAPTSEFGGYTIKSIGTFDENSPYGLSGAYAPGKVGGYEATKSDIQANGKPLINTFKYDASGVLTGRTVRVFEGSDSGTEFELDASDNIVGASKFDYSEAWKQTAIPLLEMATLAAAPYLKGAGLFTKAAAGAGFGAANAALRGKEGSDLLKAAALGGAGSAVGAGLGEAAGKAAGEFAGNLFTNPDLASIATQATRGAVESGIKAIPGAIATGDTGRLVSGALTGGALGAASSLAGDVELPFTKQQAEAGINLIRAVNSGNMVSAANSAAALINNPDITVATRAATLLKAMQSGNIRAIMAAAQMLGNTVAKSPQTSIKTAEAPGGAFETSAIIDEFGDTGGTLVPGEGGDSVNIFGIRSPEDISLDYFFSPDDTSVGQKVDVQAKTDKTDAGDLLDTTSDVKTLTDDVGQSVKVIGEKLPTDGLSDIEDLLDATKDSNIKTLTGDADQSVKVTGEKLPTDNLDDIEDLLNVTKDTSTGGDQKVTVQDKKIKSDELDDFINLMDKDLVDQRVDVTGKKLVDDVTDQKVDVVSTKLPPEDTGKTTTTTTTTTTPPPQPPKPKTTTPDYSTAFTPMQEAAPAQAFRPGVVTDAYEVLFGPGAPSLMGFTKAERAKQMLARKREEEENPSDTAYEHLMSMADRDPVGTVDQLMKFIKGA